MGVGRVVQEQMRQGGSFVVNFLIATGHGHGGRILDWNGWYML